MEPGGGGAQPRGGRVRPRHARRGARRRRHRLAARGRGGPRGRRQGVHATTYPEVGAAPPRRRAQRPPARAPRTRRAPLRAAAGHHGRRAVTVAGRAGLAPSRSAREQPRVDHELACRSGSAPCPTTRKRTASATSDGSIHGTGSRLPAERLGDLPRRLALHLRQPVVERRVDAGRVDRDDADAVRRELDRPRLRQPGQAPLGGRVVRQPAHPAQPGDRGVVDDHARAAPRSCAGSRGGRRSTRP